MTDQRKRLEKALRGCAEAGVSDSIDLWPAVRERATGERMRDMSAVEERDEVSARRRFRVPQLVPNTPLGWVLAAVSVLIVGAGVYAAAEPVRELYRLGMPGTVEPGSKKVDRNKADRGRAAEGAAVSTELFEQAVPGGLASAERVNQVRTEEGGKVTLEWAYADTDFVVLGFSVEDLQEDRRNAGNMAALEPIFVSKEDEDVPSAPDRRSELTDEAGRHFGSIDGTATVAGPGGSPEEIRAPKAHTAVFEVPEGLDPTRGHRFRFEVFLDEVGVPSSMAEAEEGYRSEPKPPIGPLSFDFEIPVQPIPTVEVGQAQTVKGITLTLERVMNSSGRPQAVVCFEPPDKDHHWRPSTAPTGFQTEEPLPVRQLEGDCWSLVLDEPAEGRSSVTVTELFGYPQTAEAMRKDEDGPQIRGPWIFEFEAPER